MTRSSPMWPAIFLPLNTRTRGLVLTDRTRRAVGQRVAVGVVLHAEVVALHTALEALTLGGARDVDLLAVFKQARR